MLEGTISQLSNLKNKLRSIDVQNKQQLRTLGLLGLAIVMGAGLAMGSLNTVQALPQPDKIYPRTSQVVNYGNSENSLEIANKNTAPAGQKAELATPTPALAQIEPTLDITVCAGIGQELSQQDVDRYYGGRINLAANPTQIGSCTTDYIKLPQVLEDWSKNPKYGNPVRLILGPAHIYYTGAVETQLFPKLEKTTVMLQKGPLIVEGPGLAALSLPLIEMGSNNVLTRALEYTRLTNGDLTRLVPIFRNFNFGLFPVLDIQGSNNNVDQFSLSGIPDPENAGWALESVVKFGSRDKVSNNNHIRLLQLEDIKGTPWRITKGTNNSINTIVMSQSRPEFQGGQGTGRIVPYDGIIGDAHIGSIFLHQVDTDAGVGVWTGRDGSDQVTGTITIDGMYANNVTSNGGFFLDWESHGKYKVSNCIIKEDPTKLSYPLGNLLSMFVDSPQQYIDSFLVAHCTYIANGPASKLSTLVYISDPTKVNRVQAYGNLAENVSSAVATGKIDRYNNMLLKHIAKNRYSSVPTLDQLLALATIDVDNNFVQSDSLNPISIVDPGFTLRIHGTTIGQSVIDPNTYYPLYPNKLGPTYQDQQAFLDPGERGQTIFDLNGNQRYYADSTQGTNHGAVEIAQPIYIPRDVIDPNDVVKDQSATPTPTSTTGATPTATSTQELRPSATPTATRTATPTTEVPKPNRLYLPLLQQNRRKAELEKKDDKKEKGATEFILYGGVWQPIQYNILYNNELVAEKTTGGHLVRVYEYDKREELQDAA